AVDHIDVTVVVHAPDIPGSKERTAARIAPHQRRGLLRVFLVSPHHPPAIEGDLTRLAARQFAIGLDVENARLETDDRDPYRGRPLGHLAGPDDGDAAFGKAVDLV